MKRYKKILIGAVCIIVIANLPPITPFFSFALDKERHYRYSNYNGSLTFSEYWTRGFKMMKNRHDTCMHYRPELKDKNIYRLFTKNPFAFWRWRLYFVEERYKLPYKRFEDIEKIRREENVKEIFGCPMEF